MTSSHALDFASAIRKIRGRYNLSQVDMARNGGVTKSYICKIEAGVRDPSLEVIGRFCRKLKLPIFVFYALAENQKLADALLVRAKKARSSH